MNNAQIIITTKVPNEKNYSWGFTIGKTGVLDYLGKIDDSNLNDLSNWQMLHSSTFFHIDNYTYLPKAMKNPIEIYVEPSCDISNPDLFSFITHIGPILLAIECDDPYLAGRLFFRRYVCFDKFIQLSLYILEPIIARMYFCLKFSSVSEVTAFNGKSNVPVEELKGFYDKVKKTIGYDDSDMSLTQAYIQYFKSQKSLTLTLPIVGKSYHRWSDISECDEIINNFFTFKDDDNILSRAEKTQQALSDLYESLAVNAQIEPYNPFDENAIAVSIESISAKFIGVGGMSDAGYFKRLVAEVLRKAFPAKLSYKASLQSTSHDETVIKISI